MEFLIWHYSDGLKLYFRRWFYALGWVAHYFSLTLLPLSLFSPWKRLIDTDTSVGFNFEREFRQLTFNLISRLIGAVVRIILFVSGLVLIIPVFGIGLIGLTFWLLVPPIGLPYFLLHDPEERRFLTHLINSMQADPNSAVKLLLNSPAGKFLATHVGLPESDLIDHTRSLGLDLAGFIPDSFTSIVRKCIDSGTWDKNLLRKKGVDLEDLVTAAIQWDLKAAKTTAADTPLHFARPGVGLDLLYGFTPTLNSYSTDLSLPRSFTHRLIGREEVVSRIERSLSSGRSVVLSGLPGVGKTTILLELAKRSREGLLGKKLVYKRILELDYNFLLSGSMDVNQKKATLSALLTEASQAGNIILVIKDLHRLTHVDVEGLDFTDLFESQFATGKLLLVAVGSRVDYERFLSPNIRLRKYLEPIVAETPNTQTATEILLEFAIDWEARKPHLVITSQALRGIISGCEKYITDTPYPEKALELLDHVVTFADKNKSTTVTLADVNQVIAEVTGISLARLDEQEKRVLTDLEHILHTRLIGQDHAIDLIAKSLRARSIGAKNESRPLGSFLFLGPTGVGKTETAKALSALYYGSTDYILRFDMAEYVGSEGLERLLGSVSKNLPGHLTTSIKNHPASLLLLDEIEKAPPEIYNLFLSLLDEGSLTDAFGKTINCRHLFVIATSNAGAEFIREQVKSNTSVQTLQKTVLEYVQKHRLFSPEFLNRFDGVVVYEPLTQDQSRQIAKLMLADLIKNMDTRGITLSIDDRVYTKLSTDGYEPEFGARPMRRLVDITVGDVIAKSVLSDRIQPGDKALLTLDDQGNFAIEKKI